MTAVTAYLVGMDIRGSLTGAGIALGLVAAVWGGAALANAEPDTAPVVVEAPVKVAKTSAPEPVVTPEPAPVVVPEVVVPEPVVEQPAPAAPAPEPVVEPEPVMEAPASAPLPIPAADPGFVAPPLPAPPIDEDGSSSYTSGG